MPRVVVIGGGIAGLAAAYELRERAEVTLIEATERVGGKLRTSEIAGVPVDEGAEAMLARVPEAVGLAREIGCDPVPAGGGHTARLPRRRKIKGGR